MTAFPRLAATCKPLLKPFSTLCASAALCTALCAPLALPAQALAISDDPVLRRMDSVLEENARLRDEAWKSRKLGKDASRQADEALAASDERVEKTRAEALAHVAGVSPAQVDSLRKDGRSWGQAAGELGVHPGFLGIGKTPIYEPQSARRKAAAEAKQAKVKPGKKTKGVEKAAVKSPAKAETKADVKKGADKKSAAKKPAKAEARKAKAEPKAPAKSDRKHKKDRKAD